MLTTNKYAHIAHGMCYWTSHYVVIPTLHFWNTGHSWRIVTINSHLRLIWFLLINLLTFHFTKNGVCSSIWIRWFPSHATSKTCQSSPFICNMMPPKCCSHLRFNMANRRGSAAMCSSPLCLQASPLSAKGHLRILLNDGPFSKQPSHCMHCRQNWALESSCIVWLHHMTLCSSMTQLRAVGGRQGSWPGSIAHMPETRRSASCFKFFVIFLLSYDVLHDYKFTSPNIRTCMAHGEAPAIKVAITYCSMSIETIPAKTYGDTTLVVYCCATKSMNDITGFEGWVWAQR